MDEEARTRSISRWRRFLESDHHQLVRGWCSSCSSLSFLVCGLAGGHFLKRDCNPTLCRALPKAQPAESLVLMLRWILRFYEDHKTSFSRATLTAFAATIVDFSTLYSLVEFADLYYV